MDQAAGCPEGCDEDEEAGARLGEAGESRAQAPDAAPPSRGEVGGGDEGPWPTIGANVGLGTMTEAGLDLLIEHARGVDRRLGCHRGGARSAPRARDLDHTPYHAAGSTIERVLAQDSHRSPFCSKQFDRTQSGCATLAHRPSLKLKRRGPPRPPARRPPARPCRRGAACAPSSGAGAHVVVVRR